MPYTDTSVSNLVINVLTEDQYESIQNPSDSELFLITDDGGGSGGGGFKITFSCDSEGEYVIDKTFQEIVDAYESGEILYLVDESHTFDEEGNDYLIGTLSRFNDYECEFKSIFKSTTDDLQYIVTYNICDDDVHDAEKEVLGSGSGGGGFKITLSYDSEEEEYSIDKTFDEILTAYNNNSYIYILDNTFTVSNTENLNIPLISYYEGSIDEEGPHFNFEFIEQRNESVILIKYVIEFEDDELIITGTDSFKSGSTKYTACTLPIFNAAGNTTVSVSGITPSSNPVLTPLISSTSDIEAVRVAGSHIYKATTGTGNITFYSDAPTSTSITVQIKDY